MDMTVYEECLAQLDMHDKIMAGKLQADSGNLLDGPETIDAIGKRHGISV